VRAGWHTYVGDIKSDVAATRKQIKWQTARLGGANFKWFFHLPFAI
jgi:hypothetical protein